MFVYLSVCLSVCLSLPFLARPVQKSYAPPAQLNPVAAVLKRDDGAGAGAGPPQAALRLSPLSSAGGDKGGGSSNYDNNHQHHDAGSRDLRPDLADRGSASPAVRSSSAPVTRHQLLSRAHGNLEGFLKSERITLESTNTIIKNYTISNNNNNDDNNNENNNDSNPGSGGGVFDSSREAVTRATIMKGAKGSLEGDPTSQSARQTDSLTVT